MEFVLQSLQSSTIGLVTLDEMKAKQENIVREREKKLAQKQAEKEQRKTTRTRSQTGRKEQTEKAGKGF